MDYSIYISEQDYADLKNLLPLLGKIIFSVDQTKQEQQLYSRFDDELRKIESPGTANSAKNPGNVNSAQIVHIGGDDEDMQKLKYGDGSITPCLRTRKDGTLRRYYQGRIYIDGKQTSVYANTKAECEAKLKALRSERKAKFEEPGESKFSFTNYGQWLDKWLELCKEGKIKRTYQDELVLNVQRVKDGLGNIKLKDLTPIAVLSYIAKLPRRNLTVKLYDIINGSLQKAEDFGLIKKNPCKAVDRPTYEAEKRRAFELSEQCAILDELTGKHRRLFFFLCSTGLRIGEFLALDRNCINFDRNVIRVKASANVQTGKIGTTKTKNSVRSIYFAPELFETFNIDELGTYTYSGIKKAFIKAYKKLGIKNVSLTHSCRHTYASMLYASGVSDKIIQSQLGHAALSTTVDVYTDILMNGKSPIYEYILSLKKVIENRLL